MREGRTGGWVTVGKKVDGGGGGHRHPKGRKGEKGIVFEGEAPVGRPESPDPFGVGGEIAPEEKKKKPVSGNCAGHGPLDQKASEGVFDTLKKKRGLTKKGTSTNRRTV